MRTLLLLAVAIACAPGNAFGQPVVSGTEKIEANRPEAWALRYFTATTLLVGFGEPVRTPGSVVVGAEGVWVPYLSEEQRRVGFNGTKLEDLNKAPLFFRPRVTIGLPRDMAATIAVVPPVQAFGIRPRMAAAAIEGRAYWSPAVNVGWRAFGQAGTARAAFTCAADSVRFSPGAPQNPAGCLAPSNDTAMLRYAGIEAIVGGPRIARVLAPHVGMAVTYFSNRIAVDALRFDVLNGTPQAFVDQTTQTSHSTNISVSGGVSMALRGRLELAVDAFYTPLMVRRTEAGPERNDGLFNAKALLSYRIR